MAGAKPQKRGGGITGLHIWLVVFVVLWLASTVVLVLMFTNQEQLRQTTAQAENALKTVVTRAEQGQPVIQAMQQQANAATPPKSLVRVMHDTIKQLGGRMTGNAEDDPKAVETQWQAIIEDIATGGKVPDAEAIGRGTGAIPALRQVYGWYVAESEAKQKALADLAEATRRNEEAVAANKKLEETFGAARKDLEKTVATVSKDKNEFSSSKSRQIDDLGKTLSAKQDEIGTLHREMDKQSKQHADELKKAEHALQEQAGVLSQYRSPGPEGTNELDIARQPVGRILRALPGDSLVHIDLGKLDGVRLGMPFSVYSYDKKVPIDGRGKASIETVNVGPHTAECRVVTPPPPEDPILEEDRVGNILLSRTRARKPRFVVLGTFDVDYDGTTDPLGYDKIAAFIERFGGERAETVDATTDYVIVGRRPETAALPPKPTGTRSATDPTAVTQRRRADRDAAFYDQSIEQAMLLAIPRLRLDQFLNFVGIELGRDAGRRLLP